MSLRERDATHPGLSNPMVDHVAIIVHDATKAAESYCTRFGMTITSDERLMNVGARLLTLSTASVDIQLVEPIAAGPLRTLLLEHGEGLHHLCLRVDEMESAIGNLGEDETGIFAGGLGRRTYFLRDPAHGVLVELAEGAPSASTLPGTR